MNTIGCCRCWTCAYNLISCTKIVKSCTKEIQSLTDIHLKTWLSCATMFVCRTKTFVVVLHGTVCYCLCCSATNLLRYSDISLTAAAYHDQIPRAISVIFCYSYPQITKPLLRLAINDIEIFTQSILSHWIVLASSRFRYCINALGDDTRILSTLII